MGLDSSSACSPADGGQDLRNDPDTEAVSCLCSTGEAWRTWRPTGLVWMSFSPLSDWMIPTGVTEFPILIFLLCKME